MSAVVVLHGGGDTCEGLLNTFFDLGDEFTVIGWDREPTVDMSYESMAFDTRRRLLEIGPAHLIGHSDGGVIALILAMQSPDLVRSMTLFGANYHHRGVRSDMVPSLAGITDPLELALVRMWLTSPTFTVKDLSGIQCPTLIAVGEIEPITDEHTASMARAIPQAQLWQVAGADHDLPKDPRFAERVRERVREFLHSA